MLILFFEGFFCVWCGCRKYEEALEFHRQAELLYPQNPSTYSAIAYIHSLTGNNTLAVDFFHKVCLSLSLYFSVQLTTLSLSHLDLFGFLKETDLFYKILY